MNQKILGDKPKHNFDDNLADVVNKIFDSKPDVEPQKEESSSNNSNKKVTDIIYEHYDFSLNTAEGWIECFKKEHNVAKKLVFASMPDMYRTFKTFKKWVEDDSFTGKNDIKDWFNSLKEKFTKQERLLTSTKLEYSGAPHSPTQCRITHYSGFESLEKTKWVSHVASASMWSLVQKDSGLEFLRTLFDTEDSMREIMDVWGWVYGGMATQIYVETPKLSVIPDYVKDQYFEPLVAYASLKVNKIDFSEPFLIIDLTTKPEEKGHGEGVLTP